MNFAQKYLEEYQQLLVFLQKHKITSSDCTANVLHALCESSIDVQTYISDYTNDNIIITSAVATISDIVDAKLAYNEIVREKYILFLEAVIKIRPQGNGGAKNKGAGELACLLISHRFRPSHTGDVSFSNECFSLKGRDGRVSGGTVSGTQLRRALESVFVNFATDVSFLTLPGSTPNILPRFCDKLLVDCVTTDCFKYIVKSIKHFDHDTRIKFWTEIMKSFFIESDDISESDIALCINDEIDAYMFCSLFLRLLLRRSSDCNLRTLMFKHSELHIRNSVSFKELYARNGDYEIRAYVE